MCRLNKIFAFLSVAIGISLLSGAEIRKSAKCPGRCSCARDAIMCVGTSSVPRIPPNDITSLSLVNGSYREITEGSFLNLPFLQLLLLNSNSVTSINDDAFAGLPHLEYLFIENNKIQSISKHAFRGLRGLIHLSLANSGIGSLPRDVFSDLDSLIELDLRGNELQCDCKTKWMTTWLKTINATVTDVFCAGPPEQEGKKLTDLTASDFDCMSTEFVLHQILPYESISVNTFSFKNDVYVAIAQPNVGNCRVLEWNYIEKNFRSYDNITGESIIGCKAVTIEEQIFVIVAQLFGDSAIYKYDESWTKFVKFQEIKVSKISKPNDIEAFQIDNEWFFIIVDSSKAGLSTIYKWSGKGFYSYQTLHEWFRDTDSEYVNIDGKSCLILTSRSQDPAIFEWNKKTKQFVQKSAMKHMEDVIAVKSFRIKNDLFICLTRFIGDSKIMKWNTTQFIEVQDIPSRGSMILQPFSFKDRHYLVVGSDYTFSQIYIWDSQKKSFTKFEEMYVQAPRSFTPVSTDRMDFLFAASFKGSTQIFEHAIVDLSL
ncbi:leucine-rich repeat LGI family member 2a [Carcharodon carcharias]|uniref:leucine-rich repeat LGI family member 2a n=1 Tax=Carcharodon carcharias TaxID=13397 RepID=UPI001B7F55F8|nr:leucine-rich repeat LGI family member 2a [Carcharodon carcharias]